MVCEPEVLARIKRLWEDGGQAVGVMEECVRLVCNAVATDAEVCGVVARDHPDVASLLRDVVKRGMRHMDEGRCTSCCCQGAAPVAAAAPCPPPSDPSAELLDVFSGAEDDDLFGLQLSWGAAGAECVDLTASDDCSGVGEGCDGRPFALEDPLCLDAMCDEFCRTDGAAGVVAPAAGSPPDACTLLDMSCGAMVALAKILSHHCCAASPLDAEFVAAVLGYVCACWDGEAAVAASVLLRALLSPPHGAVHRACVVQWRQGAVFGAVVYALRAAPLPSKAQVCEAVRCLAETYDGRAALAVAGVVPVLHDCIASLLACGDLEPQLGAVLWTVAVASTTIQDTCRAYLDGALFQALMQCVEGEGRDIEVRVKAAGAIANLCERNAANQGAFGALGACAAMVRHVLPACGRSVLATSTALRALTALATNHASNTDVLCNEAGFADAVLALVASSSARVGVRAAEVLRLCVDGRPQVARAFVVRGAFADLLHLLDAVLVTMEAEQVRVCVWRLLVVLLPFFPTVCHVEGVWCAACGGGGSRGLCAVHPGQGSLDGRRGQRGAARAGHRPAARHPVQAPGQLGSLEHRRVRVLVFPVAVGRRRRRVLGAAEDGRLCQPGGLDLRPPHVGCRQRVPVRPQVPAGPGGAAVAG